MRDDDDDDDDVVCTQPCTCVFVEASPRWNGFHSNAWELAAGYPSTRDASFASPFTFDYLHALKEQFSCHAISLGCEAALLGSFICRPIMEAREMWHRD